MVEVPLWKFATPLMENKLPGVVVPIPTFPPLVMMKFVAVEEPMTNEGPVIPLGFTESWAQGEVVPNPKLPVEESNRNPETPALPNLIVEEAFNPPKSESAVEVALVLAPKLRVGVNENVPPPVPHAVPVFEMSPVTENWAQPVLPPALEIMRAVVLAVVAVIAVVEAKGRMLAVEVVAIKYTARAELPNTEKPSTESFAYGDVVPMPTLPALNCTPPVDFNVRLFRLFVPM